MGGRDAYNCGISRDIFDHDGVGPDANPVSEGHGADDFAPGPEEHIVADHGRLPLLGTNCDLVLNFDARATPNVPINDDAK